MSLVRRGPWAVVVMLGVFAACSSGPEPNGSPPLASSSSSSGDAATGTSSGDPAVPGPDASSSSSSGEPFDPTYPFTVSTQSLNVAGVERRYVLVKPVYPSTLPLPIVLAYHGDGGDGDQLRRQWQVELTTGNDALVVYPSQPGGWQVNTQTEDNPFLAVFDAMLADLGAQHGGDTSRVLAMGWSNGGFFVNLLACWRSSQITAATSMAGGAPYGPTGARWPNDYQRCNDQRPVPYMAFHGDADGVVPFSSGEFSARYWAYVNRCADAQGPCAARADAFEPYAGDPSCQRYADTSEALPSILCSLHQAGHAIWERSAPLSWQLFRAQP